MRRISSLLGVFGVALLWGALALPVRRYDDPQFTDRFTVLSELDQETFPGIGYLVACAVATVLVVWIWCRGPARSTGAVLAVAAFLASIWVVRIGADYSIIWDGEDASGRATGGYTKAQLYSGAWVGIAGAILTAISGVLAVLLARSKDRSA